MKEEISRSDAIKEVSLMLNLILPSGIAEDEFKLRVSAYINHLINHDFEKLIWYLYRIDVDENRVKQLLEAKEGENAAGLIADLIIERQLEKIKSRQQFRQRDNDSDENEKW